MKLLLKKKLLLVVDCFIENREAVNHPIERVDRMISEICPIDYLCSTLVIEACQQAVLNSSAGKGCISKKIYGKFSGHLPILQPLLENFNF